MNSEDNFWGKNINMKLDIMRNCIFVDSNNLESYYKEEYTMVITLLEETFSLLQNSINSKIETLKPLIDNEVTTNMWKFSHEISNLVRESSNKLNTFLDKNSDRSRRIKQDILRLTTLMTKNVESQVKENKEYIYNNIQDANDRVKEDLTGYDEKLEIKLRNCGRSFKNNISDLEITTKTSLKILINNILMDVKNSSCLENTDLRINHFRIHSKHQRMYKLKTFSEVLFETEQKCFQEYMRFYRRMSKDITMVKSNILAASRDMFNIGFKELNSAHVELDKFLFDEERFVDEKKSSPKQENETFLSQDKSLLQLLQEPSKIL